MRCRSRLLYLAIGATCCTFAGCTDNFHRTETVLLSDGRVERGIYQPANASPETLKDKRWERVLHLNRIERDEWEGSIRELQEPEKMQGQAYVAAWGTFGAADEIPAHFVRKSPDGSREGRLQATSKRTDLGLITEHVWEETLTDSVTLNDMQAARRELAELALAIAADTLQEELGPDYDFDTLIAWLKNDGVAWFEEATTFHLENSLRREPGAEERLKEQMELLAARRGLDSFEKESLAHFITGHVKHMIRDREAQPLSDNRVDELLHWLGLAPERPDQEERGTSPFETASKRVIERRYGGEEALQKRFGSLANRILGVYAIVGGLEHFHCSLRMPGTIVETTGLLTGDDETSWTFTAAQAYPFGYRMRAVSLERHPAVTKLFSDKVLMTRKDLAALASIVRGDDEVKGALIESVRAYSLTPFKMYIVNAESGKATISDQNYARLLKLLRLDNPNARRE